MSGSPLRRPPPARRLAHLLRRLVGKRNGKDLLGPNADDVGEVGDAVRDDARLARARAGDDQQRSLDVAYGVLLLRIEPLEQLALPGLFAIVHKC
jgi:hypothetical protein